MGDRMRNVALILIALLSFPGLAKAEILGGCKFNTATHQFQGNAIDQSICLLRAIKTKGAGATPQPLPDWIKTNVWQSIDLTEEQLSRFLAANKINPTTIGGPIRKRSAPHLRYFVIHDTSSPEIAEEQGFPANIDDPGYSGNKLANWNGNIRQQVNLIVGRDGQSRSYRRWGEPRPLSATKIEMQKYSAPSRQYFVHVENVQPRLKPKMSFAWIAPTPGFSPKQEERLALAYIAASVQAGRWLVPAYHFNIDQGLPDGHDDPQSTDLPSWVKRITALESAIKGGGVSQQPGQ